MDLLYLYNPASSILGYSTLYETFHIAMVGYRTLSAHWVALAKSPQQRRNSKHHAYRFTLVKD